MEWKIVACSHDCPDSCSVRVGVKNDRIEAIQGDPAHALTKGFLCGKVNRYQERVYSKQRVLYPMRRCGPKGSGEFTRISWDEALDELCARLHDTIREHGAESILPYSYGGNIARLGMYGGHALFYRMGASRLERTICTGTLRAGSRMTLGSWLATPLEEVARARLIIIWGMNVVATHVHMMPLIKAARARGAKLVVIDAYRNATARQADQYIPVRPGTDAALALGMMHVILRDNLQDDAFIAKHTVGIAELRQAVQEYTPEHASAICGVAPEQIIQLAHAYASEPAAYIRLGIGISRHGNGGMTVRTITCLPGLTGHWQHPGGGLLSASSSEYWLSTKSALEMAKPAETDPPARTINMIRIGEALTALQDPPVKAMYVYGSNPAAIAPEQDLVQRGLLRDDLFLAVHEQMFTDTTDYADLVLPATTFMEHDDVLLSYGGEYVQFSRAAIAPCGEARSNMAVFTEVARRMGLPLGFYEKSTVELAAWVLDKERLEAAGFDWQAYLAGEPMRLPDTPFLSGKEALDTNSGKIEFFSERMVRDGHPGAPAFTPAREGVGGDRTVARRYPLQLLTPPTQHFLNSSFGCAETSLRLEVRPSIKLHPRDAAQRGLQDGDAVRVFNTRGESFLAVEITTDVAEGVSVAEGMWWSKQVPAGKGINQLTSAELTDLGRGARFNECRVQVEAAP